MTAITACGQLKVMVGGLPTAGQRKFGALFPLRTFVARTVQPARVPVTRACEASSGLALGGDGLSRLVHVGIESEQAIKMDQPKHVRDGSTHTGQGDLSA